MANEVLLPADECRALAPIGPPGAVARGGRPLAPFLAQLIAARAGLAGARRRRRAEPSALARYGTTPPPGPARFERVL